MTGPDHGVSLRRRVDLALVAAGLVLLLTLSVGVMALLSVQTRQREVTELYYEAITQTDVTYVQLLDAETGVRGFLLTGDPVALEPLERILDAPEPEVDLEALLEDYFGADSDVVRTRSEAAEAAATWYRGWAEPAIEQVRTDGIEAVSVAEVERGRLLFDEVRAPLDAHTDLLVEGREEAAAGLRSATLTLVGTVVALAVLVVGGGALLWYFLRRWVTDPLEGLATDARTVAAGSTAHEVSVVGSGEVRQVAAAVEDMRHQLVQAIEAQAESRRALEESHAQLEEQTEDLKRSNRDLEQFAYVASHDLQEPLRKVASFTQLLAKRYEGQLDERADQYIAFAVDGAKRMQRLINDLLDFSRVGRIGGELADVPMEDVLDQVLSDLGPLIEETGAQVTSSGLPVVRGEAPLLTQLLQNLVGNAIKFRHPERAPEVGLAAQRDGDAWELSCHDNGIGIDPQYADRVFVIFQRLHAKEVYEGTGIGLALSKKIVEYHGGDIWIDDDVAEGATIRWRLPAPTEDVPGALGAAPDAPLADTSPDEHDEMVGTADQEDGTR
ncbi:sensor histidine kinase [Actinotalea sp. C106]|uniref:sensor histidine kinase n=1 Tax=Actinotalea sp. C106 TaxID=2908644 RepID=UPI0020288B12|nr:sensor histidine kinase [Actinotalea sp. C106]